MFRIIFNNLSQTKHRALSFSHERLFTSHKSLRSADSVSDKVKTEVLSLFKAHGLTDTQIKSIISKRPILVLGSVDDSIKPNLELFKSMGMCSSDIARMISKNPRLLELDACCLVEFFRANGFSEQQIYYMTIKHPTLYSCNANNVYQPKLEFFKSLGFSDDEVADILSSNPYILQSSLENHIIPRVQYLKRIVGTRDNVMKAIKRYSAVLDYKMEKRLEANLSIFERYNVPRELVVKIFIIGPRCLLKETCQLNENIGEVLKLGFDPAKMQFLLATRAMAVMSKELWERKLEVYRSFGWSDSEISSAFRTQPMFMTVSEQKIRKMMDFFLNKIRLKISTISKNPYIIMLSLEKRIIPRCSVLELLMSKKLIERDYSVVYAMTMNDNKFVEKLVSKFQHLVPDVVEAFKGNIDFHGFPPTDCKN